MKLKNIKIQGFKSFDDLTQINFDSTITCIVGPNGCGKSNVVDAIRWVMGEQSAKHLRGKNMEDIIFVGSQTRQASSRASIELTFMKDKSGLPPQYEGCNEISVGRALYRTGESEYFINRQNVRLKDVTDLFLGTGVGTKAYSIIEQGRVEQLITAKSEERRGIIEEAAGISKFKSRKDAALRRIEATNQNLSRLKDIITELERQVNSLDRQAKKAKRFSVIRDELKDLDLKLAALSFERLDAQQNEFLEKIKTSDGRSVELQNIVSEDEVWVEEKRLKLSESEVILNDLQQKVYEWENSLQLAESKIQTRKEDDVRYTRELEQTELQLNEVKQNLVGNQNGLEQINEKLCYAEQDSVVLSESVSLQEESLKALEDSTEQLFSTLEKTREEFNLSSRQMAEISTRREGVQLRKSELENKHKHDQQELDELTKKHKKLEAMLKDSHADLASVNQLKLSMGEKTESMEIALNQEEVRIKVEQSDLESIKEELLQKKSRLQSLEELKKNFEDYHEGTKNILQRRETGEIPSVEGTVADIIEVDKTYESAVSAVLGEVMQSVVVPTQAEGIECAEYLKTTSSGRSSFVALSLAHTLGGQEPAQREVSKAYNAALNVTSDHYLSSSIQERGLSSEVSIPSDDMAANTDVSQRSSESSLDTQIKCRGVKGELKSFVTLKPGYEHLSSLLFGDVILVDSIKNALEAWIKFQKPVVTLEGESISAQGILTGGTLENTSKALLEKKREMGVLEEVIQELVNKVSTKEVVCQEMQRKITALKKELEEVKHSSHQEEINIANQEKDILHFNREIESLNNLRHKLSQVVFSTLEAVEDCDKQLEGFCEEEKKQKEIHQKAQDILENRKSEEETSRQELSFKQEALTKLKIDLARALEQKAYLLQETERLIAEDVRLNLEIIRLEEKTQYFMRRQEFIQARIRFLEKYIQKVITQKDSVDGQYREAKNNFEELNSTLREKEHSLKIKQREYNEIKDELNQATVQLTEARAELSRNNEQVLERYQLVLSDVYKDYLSDTSEFDVSSSQERASELRRRFANLGNVNLGAIDELDELKERFEFLTAQRQDLEDSLQALERAIQKINRTTRKRFKETFELVNDKFTKLFPRLFKGGHAYMQLTDPENILETGVDIIAQPPGKKLQSVSLLSGGEKALTAISLLFAIFLIKPSPFCLLDEVDAPLDDVNVDRYNEIVAELSQNTQFIVITHNKRTMQSTSCLFGVTMQEDGVSKVVSVAMD